MSNQTLYNQVAETVLPGVVGAQRHEGESLVRALVDLWLDGASAASPAAIVKVGTTDLARVLEGLPAAERLVVLQQTLTRRRVDQLVRQALALALPVARGQQRAADARHAAEELAAAINDLLPEVRALPEDQERQRLLNDLANADLDCRYVLDGGSGATSLRLAHQLNT